jgi:hypothetical protein
LEDSEELIQSNEQVNYYGKKCLSNPSKEQPVYYSREGWQAIKATIFSTSIYNAIIPESLLERTK